MKFPGSMRLKGDALIADLLSRGQRRTAGPLVAWVLENELKHPRLGLRTARAVGTAVRRNRLRRMLREAFRQLPPTTLPAVDLLVSIRPHAELSVGDYQSLLRELTAPRNRRTPRARPDSITG